MLQIVRYRTFLNICPHRIFSLQTPRGCYQVKIPAPCIRPWVDCQTDGSLFNQLLAVFKIRKSGEPELLAAKLKRESSSGKIMIENAKLKMVQDGFVYRGSTKWNMLPNSLKLLQENKFKVELKQWVMLNIHFFICFIKIICD